VTEEGGQKRSDKREEKSVRFIADFHIHSHYSMATSKDCCPEQLNQWARLKGLQVIGTGDFTHPGWIKELKEKLQPAEEGLYQLKPEYARPFAQKMSVASTAASVVLPAGAASAAGADNRQAASASAASASASDNRQAVRFLLSAEISSIYKKNGRVRKIHNLLLVPDIASAERINAVLERVGNIHSDGRPILGLDSRKLLEIALDCCPQVSFIPAHIWTPHFSLLGSRSGFDSLEECFEDLSGHIFALETGLSSDPAMNWRLSALDRYSLVSNSDAHSPKNLAREANCFETDLSYPAIMQALKAKDPQKFLGTIEFYPEEGKYHYDGHRNCQVCWSPEETRAAAGICPRCGRKVTIGVMYRVTELADHPYGRRPDLAQPYESIVPLLPILAEFYQVGESSKKVQEAYFQLLARLGSEMEILRTIPLEEIQSQSNALLAEGFRRVRAGEIKIRPGFDGEYGKVKLFDDRDRQKFKAQTSLFGLEDSPTGKGRKGDREKGREGDREKGREGDSGKGREEDSGKGREEDSEKGREGDSEKGREGDREKRREGDREKGSEGEPARGRCGEVGKENGNPPQPKGAENNSDITAPTTTAPAGHQPAAAPGSHQPVVSPGSHQPVVSPAGHQPAAAPGSHQPVVSPTVHQSPQLGPKDEHSSRIRQLASINRLDPLSQLNEEQRLCVTSSTGPTIIIAGPGTGKTRTLVCRIAHLIQFRKIPAEKILAITFTNKAAQELKSRIRETLPLEIAVDGLVTGTFHHLCLSILQEELKGAASRDSGNSDSSNEDSASSDSSNRDSSNEDSANRDSSNRDSNNGDAANRDSNNGDSASRDSSNRDSNNGDAANRDSSNRDSNNEDSASRDSGNSDSSNEDSANRDSGNRDSNNGDAANRDSSNRDSNNEDAASRDSGNSDYNNGDAGGKKTLIDEQDALLLIREVLAEQPSISGRRIQPQRLYQLITKLKSRAWALDLPYGESPEESPSSNFLSLQLSPGNSLSEQPLSEQPLSGQLSSEQPLSEQPLSGQPLSEQPLSGQLSSEQPSSGKSLPGQHLSRQSSPPPWFKEALAMADFAYSPASGGGHYAEGHLSKEHYAEGPPDEHSADVHAAQTHAAQTQAADAHPAEAHTTGAYVTGARPDKTHAVELRPGGARPGGARPGEAHPAETHPGKEHTTGAYVTGARPDKTHAVELRPGEAHPGKEHPGEEQLWSLCLAYQNLLHRYHAYDYDDLLLEVVKLLQSDPAALQKYRDRFSHILVDEFQDVNEIQYLLIKLLAADGIGLLVIGDPDQSIYGFRGADYRFFFRLQGDFPGHQLFHLKENYRSRSSILQAASAVIKHNPDRFPLELQPHRPGGREPRGIQLHFVGSEQAEGISIVREITRMMGGIDMLQAHGQGRQAHGQDHEGAPSFEDDIDGVELGFSDFAVLFRTGQQAGPLEECFLREGIPYRVVGQKSFLQNRYVQTVLAMLRFLVNPEDDFSLWNLLHRWDAVSFSEHLIRHRLQETANRNRCSLFSAIEQCLAMDAFSPGTRGGLQRILSLQENYHSRIREDSTDRLISDLIQQEIKATRDKDKNQHGGLSQGEDLNQYGDKNQDGDLSQGEDLNQYGDKNQNGDLSQDGDLNQDKGLNQDKCLNQNEYLNQDKDLNKGLNDGRDLERLYQCSKQFSSVSEFLQHLLLFRDGDMEYRGNKTSASGEAVSLMTIHAAKGLEFPVIFICGLEEGLLPYDHRDRYNHRYSQDSQEKLQSDQREEERRLFYVALTRAKDELVLISARHRRRYSQLVLTTPSSFLAEIPPDLIITSKKPPAPKSRQLRLW
jgi:uncharacterized protein (TIGR00375 family)